MLTLICSTPEISSIYRPNPCSKSWENGGTTFRSSQFGVLDSTGHSVAGDKVQTEASGLGHEVKTHEQVDSRS